MIKDYSLHEDMPMPDPNFPIKLSRYTSNQIGEVIFSNHWHEQLEFLYFIKGQAIIRCNSVSIPVQSGDLIVINSNDLHNGQNISDELVYYCIIADTTLLHSRSVDICEAKYITPIIQNRILFKNKICTDNSVTKSITNLIQELDSKEIGFELAIKSYLYQLLFLLIRKHVSSILTPTEYNARIKNLERFNPILNYVENHYTEEITVDQLCAMANMSRFHFCRLFKEITGQTSGEYINQIRINQAEYMLKNTNMNVTETALASGFNNLNYFSRLFRKYKKISPSAVMKKRFP